MYNGLPASCLPIHLWYLRKSNIKHHCISKTTVCLIELQTEKVLANKQYIMHGPVSRMQPGPWHWMGSGLCRVLGTGMAELRVRGTRVPHKGHVPDRGVAWDGMAQGGTSRASSCTEMLRNGARSLRTTPAA